MGVRFEELDRQVTPMGEISLRRRLELSLQVDVYEVKLDDEYLMSSLFTVAEVELARLGLAAADGPDLDVVVGGLGLGYTARAALEDPRVRSLDVVEALGTVIEWHERELLPVSGDLVGDARCRLVEGDFFARVAAGEPFRTSAPDRVHAVLLDVDHSPSRHLHPRHAPFYAADGLRQLADRLAPGGVFALWSDDDPDEAFTAVLDEVFDRSEAHVVPFANPYAEEGSTNTVYVARTAG